MVLVNDAVVFIRTYDYMSNCTYGSIFAVEHKTFCYYYMSTRRTLSSVGRATPLHGEGRRSESYRVHYFAKATKCTHLKPNSML